MADDITADALARTADRLRRAILTLHGARDRDRAFLYRDRVAWPDIVRDATQAYGYDSTRRRRFEPTPADIDDMLPALSLLARLGRSGESGERAVRIITGRAFDVPWWRLADRFGRSDRQVQRWFQAAIGQIWHWEGEEGAGLRRLAC